MSGQSSRIRQDHLDHLVAMALAIASPQAFCALKKVISFLRDSRAIRTPGVFNADITGVFHTLDSIETVARSRQVYIELVAHCLLPILPG
jgi:hypothetical protein